MSKSKKMEEQLAAIQAKADAAYQAYIRHRAKTTPVDVWRRAVAAALLDAERLRRLLKYAVEATTEGPVKWLVKAEYGKEWTAWVESGRALLTDTTE